MKRIILIELSLIVLNMFWVVSNKANNIQKETYVTQTIINASWGREPGHFGVYALPEGGPVAGPETFTIAPNGDIYIEDGINTRVQRFNSTTEELLNVIPVFMGAEYDFCVDQNGDIYMLYAGLVPSQVWKYDQNGNVLKKYKLSHGSGPLFCDKQGRLFIGGPTVYQFGTISEEFTPEQQKATLREGFAGSNNVVLNQGKIFQTKEGKLHLVEFDSTVKKTGKSDKEFSLYRLNLYPYGVAGFTGVDEQMNVYTTSGSVIRKYNSAGDLMAEFTIQKDDYIWTSRSLVLDEHGNIYVMSTSKDGLKIIKWSSVEGGK